MSFQLSVVCDNGYDGTNRQRCVAIIYYQEIGYTQNAAGEQLIAGTNGPGNSKLFVHFVGLIFIGALLFVGFWLVFL